MDCCILYPCSHDAIGAIFDLVDLAGLAQFGIVLGCFMCAMRKYEDDSYVVIVFL